MDRQATPFHQRSLEIPGVDVAIHSATKYIGGHSDILAGAVTVKHRRPFAMGYEHGMPIWYEYKIFELQKAAAAEDAAAR